MQHTSPHLAPSTSSRRSFLGLVLASALTLGAVSMGACSSPEVDDVREYKLFLEKAKPSLTGMNKAREDLYQVNDPDQMLPLFRDNLLPQIDALSKAAQEQPAPRGKLGEIHTTLQGTVSRYVESTRKLVDKLKSGKDEDREAAIVMWGEDDQKFGKEMTGLVNDLSAYLGELKK